MKNKEKVKVLIEALEILKEDAQMAISGEWEISEYGLNSDAVKGFEAQIELVDITIALAKK